jgi:phenylalanyl-tRNA synthetase beta chain
MGQVHPRVAERFEVEGVELYAAEIDLSRLLALAREEVSVVPIPRFPAVQRDLALLVNEDVTHDELTGTVRAAAGPLLESLELFDVYRGAPVPEGHRSLAYSLTFRSPERTLAESEVTSALDAIEREVGARYGARVRGR